MMKPRPDNRRLIERRHALGGIAAALSGLAGVPRVADAQSRARTPQQTLGPFYPRSADERPAETDADLVTVANGRVLARGTTLYLTGRVVDSSGRPAAASTVEIWQCDANAIYHHPAGGAETERDPNFQGYGVATTDASGVFHFRTIRPVPYPGRTAHIHVRVQSQGRASLATQLYLPDQPENRRDFLYARMSPGEQAALALKLAPTAAGESHPLAQSTQFTARVELVV